MSEKKQSGKNNQIPNAQGASPQEKRALQRGETELSNAAKAGKLLRSGITNQLRQVKDSTSMNRLTKQFMLVQSHDELSEHGYRKVALGIDNKEALLALKGFEFNKDRPFNQTLKLPYRVTLKTGTVHIDKLIPASHLVCPDTATHAALRSIYLLVNFNEGVNVSEHSKECYLTLTDTKEQNIALTPAMAPNGAGIRFMLLQINFYKMVSDGEAAWENGVYPIGRGRHNSLTIVEAG